MNATKQPTREQRDRRYEKFPRVVLDIINKSYVPLHLKDKPPVISACPLKRLINEGKITVTAEYFPKINTKGRVVSQWYYDVSCGNDHVFSTHNRRKIHKFARTFEDGSFIKHIPA